MKINRKAANYADYANGRRMIPAPIRVIGVIRGF